MSKSERQQTHYATFLTYQEQYNIEFVDLRFTDLRGKEHHLTLNAEQIDSDFFEQGVTFDGSSIQGWKGVENSDMILFPLVDNLIVDPFFKHPTLQIRCNIIDPEMNQPYPRDPRHIARQAERYLQNTGIADTVLIGPEPEFFVFDNVTYKSDLQGSEYKIYANNAAWSSNDASSAGRGHYAKLKGGYFPVPPVDALHEVRADICHQLTHIGQIVELHHHEVATAGQCEVGTKFDTLTSKADQTQQLKYIVHNVAQQHNKTATFMPKPIPFDNGSGMHVHQSLLKDGKNIFLGQGYAGLSEIARYYIGGIIRHAKAISAFSNPTTNSYKRLIPGYEAPTLLAYSACNRSAAIRIPYAASPKAKRVELRFGDPSANPYLMFSAMLMAGIDGIMQKIEPGEAMDHNLYELPSEQLQNIPRIASSLEEALTALDQDRDFLTKGNVFSHDTIDAYIQLRQSEVQRLSMVPHPVEFDMYYSV